ncbi:MAG: RagB/SusD family nutrient uptake outer membrane protein [Mangrovibacterium sp.]
MMMKNILKHRIILFSAACAILLTTACDEFLTTSPESYMTPEEFLNSRSWAEASLSGVYKTFHSEYYQFDMFVNGDVTSDLAYAGGDNNANFEIDDLKVTPTNGNVKRDWGYLYEAIGTANAFLNKVDSIQDENFSQVDRDKMKGEVMFIRAVHYFNLVQLWGGVPLVLKADDQGSSSLPRATVNEVYAQIIKDLEFGIEHLPVTSSDKGRIKKASAEGLLAKVYASMPSKDYSKVLEYCNAVLADGQYSLAANYGDLFDGTHENTSESLFEIQFMPTVAGNWGVQLFLPPSLTQDGWKKFNTPSKELIEAYDEEGDQLRKNANVLFEDVSGKYSDDIWGTNMPFSYKLKQANGWNSGNNIVYLRLADIILLKAEALNEQSDLNGAATELNKIRARVNLDPKNPATQTEMRLAIEKERMLELALEGHRWFDLKRTGRALNVMKAAGTRKPNQTYSYIDQNDLLWPIPQSEIDKNPALTQNPGY